MTEKKFSIWSGVYESFAEAGGCDDFFESDYWINKQKSTVLKKISEIENKGSVSKDYPLALVCAMLLASKKNIKILDFGGGMGHQYIDLVSKVFNAEENIKFFVVDGKSSVDNRPQELDRFSNLYFSSSLDDVKATVDIVHIGSTLQYIEDYKGLLLNLQQKFDPEYFVFSDLLAGDIPSFVTNQQHFEKLISVNMISESEINELFAGNFQILYKSRYSAGLIDSVELPMLGMPKKYTLETPINLVYKRVGCE